MRLRKRPTSINGDQAGLFTATLLFEFRPETRRTIDQVSGNIMMPALSAGIGGAYGFGRALGGGQQAYNRYLIGGASGAEYAALRARQFFGVQPMPQRPGVKQNAPVSSGTGSTGTGAQMLAQLARLGRLGRR